jgi:hypothetical protein
LHVFAQASPQTMLLLISASQVAGVISVNNHAQSKII